MTAASGRKLACFPCGGAGGAFSHSGRFSPGLGVIPARAACLYFANSTTFTAEVLQIVENADPPLHTLVLVASSIGDIDYSGADSLRQVHEELTSKGITLLIADLDPSVRTSLDAYGLTQRIGAQNLSSGVPLHDVIAASTSGPGPATT